MTNRSTLIAAGLALAWAGVPTIVNGQGACTLSPNVTVVASGLDNPRGLKFGPDGYLYVAEGGVGGSQSTNALCPQVIPPIGPYTGGYTGRISKIDHAGAVTTVVSGLPSSQTSNLSGNLVSGVGDVAFIGDTLYGVLSGAGCSHGVADVPNGILRVDAGSTQLIADLSAFQAQHPVAAPEVDDFEPDGTWYSMVAVRAALYAVEPNHGEIDRITPDGGITRVVDISAKYGHIVPTAIDYDGNFYVGTLGTFEDGLQGRVIKVTPSGQTLEIVSGLNSIMGLVESHGALYVLENEGGFPTPCAGRVLRVPKSGNLAQAEEIASGMMLPTGMTMGPDGNLYVSNFGFGFGAGAGQVLRIDLH